MKRLLVLLVAGGFASLASAQSAPVEPTLEPGAAAIGTDASDAKVNDRNCLRQTGSLVTTSANRKAAFAFSRPPSALHDRRWAITPLLHPACESAA